MTGSVTISCGCTFYDDSWADAHLLAWADEYCDPIDGFQPAYSFGRVCPACRRRREANGEVFFETEEAADAWLAEQRK